jgi:hypothetical protein
MTGFNSKRSAAVDKLQEPEREALKLALEALRMADELCRGHGVDFKEYGLEFDKDIQVKYRKAITAIKEALAQLAQEPVAWMTPHGEGFRIRFSPPTSEVPLGWDALYTAPPQRQWIWLSDADIRETIDSICQYKGDYDKFLCKKIEQKIKELHT